VSASQFCEDLLRVILAYHLILDQPRHDISEFFRHCARCKRNISCV
jgi:hypothetical protein